MLPIAIERTIDFVVRKAGALTQWQLAIAHALNQLSPRRRQIGASLRAVLRSTRCRESSA
jgi:hypothetical protein